MITHVSLGPRWFIALLASLGWYNLCAAGLQSMFSGKVSWHLCLGDFCAIKKVLFLLFHILFHRHVKYSVTATAVFIEAAAVKKSFLSESCYLIIQYHIFAFKCRKLEFGWCFRCWWDCLSVTECWEQPWLAFVSCSHCCAPGIYSFLCRYD